jgi:hypothetical protein
MAETPELPSEKRLTLFVPANKLPALNNWQYEKTFVSGRLNAVGKVRPVVMADYPADMTG